MASVSVKNVSKSYAVEKRSEVGTLNNVSFEVADRAFAVLVGPPGCGGSAVLRVIAGLDEASTGEIHIGDKRVNDLTPKDRDIAMVFRDYALYPQMTVRENLAFGLKIRKFSSAESKRRVTDTAGILGIDSLLGEKAGALDRIQRFRVALGRALVRQAKVVLLDDPLANLKSNEREQMRAELMKLHHRVQMTMICVTHDPNEAMIMADQVSVMNEGKVQQTGAPLTVYDQPANWFVAEYLGTPPMNRISGRLKHEGDRLRFDEDDGGTISISFPANERPGIQDFPDNGVILGIRPEDLRVVALGRKEARAAGNAFPAIVELVEPTGVETKLYLSTGVHNLICRSRENFDRGEAGHRFQFEIDLAKAHFFDPRTTDRLF
jgi:multiple sugar transport system ATP-binding protein